MNKLQGDSLKYIAVNQIRSLTITFFYNVFAILFKKKDENLPGKAILHYDFDELLLHEVN